ncbi:hypothetical protein [Streptomyces sp. NPDC047000]|uniref:hypothetical protein n=1 Tax=Streptomyces sp. NPDC047000 TaxID=3155474 RepID=UPI0033FE2378
MKRTIRTTLCPAGALLASPALPAGAAHADDATPRTGSRVPAAGDGGPATAGIAAGPRTSGTPYTGIGLGPVAGPRYPVAPGANPRTKDTGTGLRRRGARQAAPDAGQVTAHRIGSAAPVGAPAGLSVPATVPSSAAGAAVPAATAGTAREVPYAPRS